MRQRFLAVQGETFDPKAVKDDIERVARLFGEYLHGFYRSGGGSKHRALGAAGKALRQARGGLRGDALLGYARRVHEQTTKSTFPAGAVEKLDEGICALNVLLEREDIPAREKSDIVSQIDYATYYDVRRRQVEALRQSKHRWDTFVRANAERLALRPAEIADIEWFSKDKVRAKGPTWAKALDEFLAQAPAEIVIDAADDEEEA